MVGKNQFVPNMNPYKTTYGQDYRKKPFGKFESNRFEPPGDNKDLIEYNKKMLVLHCEKPIITPEECVDDYLNTTFKEKYDDIANRYFKEPLDKKVIDDYNKDEKETMYQTQYCKRWEAAKLASIVIPKLSDDHIIAETTHLCHYRPPITLTEAAYDKIPPVKQSVGLGFEMNLPDEARAKMGISEYVGKYCPLAEMILDYNIHKTEVPK